MGNYVLNYQLTVGSFNKTASTLGDSLTELNGSMFSTKDIDNDKWRKSCSTEHGSGGWWFGTHCARCNVNGINSEKAPYHSGITWYFGGDRGNTGKSWKTSELSITKIAN